MGKSKEINNFFSVIDLFKELDYDKLYNKLIYGNVSIQDNIEILSSLYEQISNSNKKLINDNKCILIEEGIESNQDKKMMEIGLFISLENVFDVISQLLEYFKKKKFNYCMKILVKNQLCQLKIILDDKGYLDKIIDYINGKLGKKLEVLNPLIFSDEKVSLSVNLDYSYEEILGIYLYEFIDKYKDVNVSNYSIFKKYVLDKYYNVTNQVNLHEFLKYNKKKISLSKFFKNVEIITTLIVYLMNEKELDDYCDYMYKLMKEEKKNKNVYNQYDDLSVNMDLFNELVNNMYLKYGEEYAKNSIINYINTGKKEYITRDNNLRKKVMDSKTFMVFLYTIDYEKEFKQIIDFYKFNNKKKILEQVCKETYLTCNDYEKCNSGKIQIARTLIRISCGDYSSVTRQNKAREMAVKNIQPDEVVQLIQETLQIDNVKKEAMLYELYAEYIEKLCMV